MNCNDIRARMPLFVYDDLEAAESKAIANHLTDCAACQAEHAAIVQIRASLDAVAVPTVALNPFVLLRSQSERQAIQTRRWRRTALIVGALAASLFFVLAFRVEIRAGAGEIALTWGARKVGSTASQLPVPMQPGLPNPLDERVQLVQDLARALVAEVESRDGQTRNEIVFVKGQVAALHRLSADRWNETERDVAALYTAIRSPQLGGKP